MDIFLLMSIVEEENSNMAEEALVGIIKSARVREMVRTAWSRYVKTAIRKPSKFYCSYCRKNRCERRQIVAETDDLKEEISKLNEAIEHLNAENKKLHEEYKVRLMEGVDVEQETIDFLKDIHQLEDQEMEEPTLDTVRLNQG